VEDTVSGMSLPLWCLLGFAAWGMLVLYGIGVQRMGAVRAGKLKPNEFTAGVPHGGDAYWRWNRVHLNVCENLPFFGAIVLVGTVAGVDSAGFHWLPVVVLGARVVQSIIHLSSGSNRAVLFRFTAFGIQQLAMVGMIVEIVRHGVRPLG
jgi:uncharacterized MAPEG superfamily protein